MNDPITPFSGLEKLIEDFIKEQNNELINKKRSTSDPINQVIKKTDGIIQTKDFSKTLIKEVVQSNSPRETTNGHL